MRSLRTAGVIVVLAGCNYENPGFKVKGSGTGSGASETGESGSGVTTETSVSSTPPTTSTSEPIDPATEPVTSMTTLDTGSDETTTASTGTGSGGEWVFPTECQTTIPGTYEPALIDTFFVYEQPIGGCSFVSSMPDCVDREFSQVDYFPLFHKLNDPPLEDDSLSLFAVRFAKPAPKYMGEVPVPEHAFQSFEVRLHVGRPSPKDPWTKVPLHVHRLLGGDGWQEGDGQVYTPCLSPAASFRCRECPMTDMFDDPCKKDWGTKETPVPLGDAPLQKLDVLEEPGDEGADVPLPFAKGDLAWLMSQGLVVLTPVEMSAKMLEVKSLQSGKDEWKPALLTRYCEPTFVPN